MNKLKAPRQPCGSCPYRKDAPSGIWKKREYDKLPSYDGETWEQSPRLFMCHQQDGCVCGGWLACHDPQELLAVRLHAPDLDQSVFDYKTDVPVLASGAEARAHGLRGIRRPDIRARRMVAGITRKRAKI
jgi:hypothetical protein